MKKFLTNKKVIIALALVSVIAIGSIAGVLMGKNAVKVNPQKIVGLIEADYKPTITKENDKEVGLNIVGALSDEDLDTLIKELYETGQNWGKQGLEINFFSSDKDTKEVDFYTEGLVATVEIDYIAKTAKVGKFENVPKVDKSKQIVDYNKGEIGYKDNKLIIGLDMAVEGESIDVVSQAKAFIVMFREANKDKDISNVQLDINHNDSQKAYSFSTEYENILKKIEVRKF